jgi:hypothetical protein
VTDKDVGTSTLAELRKDTATIWASGRPARVFQFGSDRVVVDLATQVLVYAGVDANGDAAYDIVPVARSIATRVSVMQNVNATLGSWLIYNGMANKTTNCPNV